MEVRQTLDQFSYASVLMLDGVMDLLPGAHILYFHPPETDGLALQCTYDGVDDSHCHGEILHVTTQEVCAEFYMKRVGQ